MTYSLCLAFLAGATSALALEMIFTVFDARRVRRKLWRRERARRTLVLLTSRFKNYSEN